MSKFQFKNTEYYDESFNKLEFSEAEIIANNFEQCIFTSCNFSQTIFQACKFYDCEFKNCDISLIKVTDSTFSNNLIEDSKAMGINWADILVPTVKIYNPVEFVKSNINYSVFQGLDLREIQMVDCQARDVNFEDADLSLADLRHSDFANSVFRRTNLSKSNFTNAFNYSIDIYNNNLKEAIFSLPEAVSLLMSLDINLVDSYEE